MKIVLISNLFPPYVRGGAELVAYESARAFLSRGHEVTVITTAPARLGPKKYKATKSLFEGMTIYRFFPMNFYFLLDDHAHPIITRFFYHLFDAFNFHSATLIKRILKKQKPDVVITHNLKGIGLLTARVIRRLGLKQVHTLHDIQLIEPSGLLFANQKKRNWLADLGFRAYGQVTRRLFDSPEGVVSPTAWLWDFHKSLGFFPRSKNLTALNPVLINTNVKRGESWPRPYFIFVGQVEKHKGIEILLEAFQLCLADRSFDADLLIVGGGTLLTRLAQKYEYHTGICFQGRLPRERTLSLIASARTLIFPSTCLENAPGSILEALAFKVPVIASNVGGVSELVRENQTGWLVPPGDIEALARTIRHVSEHPKEREMLGEQLSAYKQVSALEYAEKLEIFISSLDPEKVKNKL